MARVALNGIEIDYAVTGRGRPVILSHGYGATRRTGHGCPDAGASTAWNQRAQPGAGDLEARGLGAFGGRSREVREALSHHRSAQGLAHAARGMLAQQDSRVIDGLASIRVPTLIIVG